MSPDTKIMRWIPVLATIIVTMALLMAFVTRSKAVEAASEHDAAPPGPVLVELYTSEGCSSCPPADAVLSELARRDNVIALGWHVDYWDRLGHPDPFADAAYSERQRRFNRAIGSGRVYTPQMVINGRVEFVGSRQGEADANLGTATPLARVKIVDVEAGSDTVRARVTSPAGGTLLVMIMEDGLSTKVDRGENAGRLLQHDAVVRSLATMPIEQDVAIEVEVPLVAKEIRRARMVVVVEEAKSMKSLAAGSSLLQPGE